MDHQLMQVGMERSESAREGVSVYMIEVRCAHHSLKVCRRKQDAPSNMFKTS
jgi:hypothetical protein